MKIVKKDIELKENNLADIFNIIGGTTPSTSNDDFWKNGDVSWIGPVDMNCDGKYIEEGRKNITKLASEKIKNKKIPVGSIILSTRAPIGYLKINSKELFTNQGCHSLNIKTNDNVDYFYYFLKNNKKMLTLISKGTTFKEVGKKELSELKIYYPAKVDQQEKISFVLSVQEKQIETLKSLIEKIEKRNGYYAEKLLSGELRVRENSETGKLEFYENEDWQEFLVQGRKRKIPSDYSPQILKNCNSIYLTRGNVISKKDIKNCPGDYPIYSSSVKNNGLMGRYGKYNFDKEMITWSVDGGGDLFYREKHKFSVTNVSGIMTLDENENNISLKYLYYLFSFQHKWFKFDYSSKAHPSVINEIYFYTGVEIKEQLLIVKIMDQLSEELEKLKQLLPKEEKRFQWMLDNLLSGEYEIVD